MTTPGLSAEVLVIGAGPAGMAAAIAAAEGGRKVIVLDDNAAPGGQIWRESSVRKTSGDTARQRAVERLQRSGAKLLHSHRVFDANADGTLHALCESKAGTRVVRLQYAQLILATGARERFLPFPGWTLSGVFGAGGLQALVQGGYPVAGKRVLVAGTGPLLLAVAAHLRAYGAEIVAVAEQARLAQLLPFAASLIASPAKIAQGIKYRARIASAPYKMGCWPVEAIADESGTALQAVKLTDGKRVWEERCDLLACGFHLVPNTELASLLGCLLRDGFVPVDMQCRTSLPNVFCVGEPTGIAGIDSALLQGEIAGMTCAGKSTAALERRMHAERKFAAKLAKAFALRSELGTMATDDTIVCRCEDVRLGALRAHIGWTEAKLQTRCGMGPCQGRICGPAVETLLGWKPSSVRPPVFPVPLQAFCFNEEKTEMIEERR